MRFTASTPPSSQSRRSDERLLTVVSTGLQLHRGSSELCDLPDELRLQGFAIAQILENQDSATHRTRQVLQ